MIENIIDSIYYYGVWYITMPEFRTLINMYLTNDVE
jgi:hypothetical protein